jgi:putative addiction module CopG family antidote
MPAKNGRNVALTREQNALIDRLVKSGRYASASEVVRDGLRLLQREDEVRLLEKFLYKGLTPAEEASISPTVLKRAQANLRAKLQEGLDDARAGRLMDGPLAMSELKAQLLARPGRKQARPNKRRRS